MPKTLLLILFITFNFFVQAPAFSTQFGSDKTNQKNALTLASLVSLNLYEMEVASLSHIVKTFLERKPEIQAVRIVESLDNKAVLQIYRDSEQFVVNKPLPGYILNQNKKIIIASTYEGEQVGALEIFLGAVPLVRRVHCPNLFACRKS